MSQLGNAGSGLLNSLYVALNNFMAFIPALFGALVILVVGWYVSGLVGRLLEKGLTRAGFEHAVAKTGVNGIIAKTGANVTTSHVVGLLFKWMILLMFIQAAANILGMPQVIGVISSIILFIPKLAVALLIVVLGSLAASVLERIVQSMLAQSGVENPKAFATLTRFAVMAFATVAALSQLEIAPVIINSLFIALIGTVALAVGLAFGLGGREVASKLTGSWYERSKEKLPRVAEDSAAKQSLPLRDASSPPRRTGT
jgi:hypothetical protein